MADRTRRDTPPTVGPYGVAEQVGGRWRVRLTDEGRVVVEAWLAGIADLLAWFSKCHPRTLAYARSARMTDEETAAACRRGLVTAAIKWQPGQSSLATTAAHWMRSAVQKEADTFSRCYRQTGRPEVDDRPLGQKGRVSVLSVLPAAVRTDDRGERKRALLDALRRIPERERAMFALHHGLADDGPLTFREVGERYGVSHQRVHQICDRVFARLSEIVRGDHA